MFPCRRATATNEKWIASSGLRLGGRESRRTPTAVSLSTADRLSTKPAIAHDTHPDTHPDTSPVTGSRSSEEAAHAPDWRLHKHADYQRVYQNSRKQFSTWMAYFVAPQPAECRGAGPRVGITAGKVLGKAVERNRIKRRMRAAIVGNLNALRADVDVVLHPKRTVLSAEWTALDGEVRRIFNKIQEGCARELASQRPKKDA